MESEKFGGEILLEAEESLYEITKRVEGWTDCAINVFGRHKSEDGRNYPDHEHMKTMNLVRKCMHISLHYQEYIIKLNSSRKLKNVTTFVIFAES